jgi:serine/threonine-protein kinase
MESDVRYEILDTIAAGEFATVSRARDRDLGREVAVKQIHAQYLADPRQLARYWHEAQLLASLQHANILTIYDVVRPRGWLILELMRGSLKPAAEGDPMDLDQLRLVLANCLTGLHFLHGNGVIHGDIKPSNILIAPPNRIKLGDFGLARRASNEEGSLLKGTTKYMAPELLSAQFGAVGAASDLYSLGFTAYELMVGAHFDSLLPTLATFGRNRQLAWMMWHSTADVKLPAIERVLEGVPEDLAHVIQKLIAKDQSQRYRSAQEALRDLQAPAGGAGGLPQAADLEAEAAAAAAARRKKRVRNFSILAGGVVAILCALIALKLFLPHKKPPVVAAAETIKGTVSKIILMSNELGVTPSDGSAVKRLVVKDQDIIYINGERHLIDDLAERDVVEITTSVDPATHKLVQEIHAVRPGRFASGRLKVRDDALRTLVMETGDDASRQDLTIFVPPDLKKISLNGEATFQGKPVTLASLNQGDRLKVQYDYQESSGTVNVADKVEALRQVELEGILAENFDGRLLSVKDDRQVVKLPFGSQPVITVNGQPVAKPSELKRGDRVKVKHDVFISQVVAQRTLEGGGVVQQIGYDARTLTVADDNGQKMTYHADPQCKITLGEETVALDVLRNGDRVTVKHEQLEAKSQSVIAATEIAAERPLDAARWALIIAVQNYDDKRLTPLNYPLADAELLKDVLTKRYRTLPEQLQVFKDPSVVEMDQEVPKFLKKVGADGRLIVYYVGHAWKDAKGQVILAPKDFRSDQPAVNGRPLQWLVDLLEDCPAKAKLLLLDGSHAGAGVEQAAEPSSAEMIRALKPQPNRALLRTVTAVASSQKGQRGIELPSKEHGVFAWCLAEGYGGAADAKRNTLVEPAELFSFLKKEMPAVVGQAETPELFLPDDRPPRLTEAAKTAIRKLASYADKPAFDLAEAAQQYDMALQAAGGEPEPRLLFGLVLLKAKRDPKDPNRAATHFELVKNELPNRLLPYAGLAWLRLEKRSFSPGIRELARMIEKIPKPADPGQPPAALKPEPFQWTGQLREYAAGVCDPADPSRRQLTEDVVALDAAVEARGAAAVALYNKGRRHSKEILDDFDKKIEAALTEADKGTLGVNRKQLANYADFPINQYKEQVLAHLDE